MELSTTKLPPGEQILSLYDSVGWSAYTDDPEVLIQALSNSTFAVYAYDQQQQLAGLIRVISDNATICYVQDILVRPSAQRSGIGRALFDAVLQKFQHVRQLVLITDDMPQQRAFYESMGLTEGAEFEHGVIRVFARFAQ
ncbi:GNAT family N-acetyltransferase [Glutamicibacter arilaitensis]|uniref:N-acetyltransferase n=3 Tax=Glutamicibacter arilaitensis TaxID=256701 RepID=A0A2N7S032_9MICC|nr:MULTISPECIES: GNAT family N-acetyltransferase [Glutamicibacter]PMQ19487.1 N-acetyltransferase [Glutamicibacter arilaitensis]CBT74572.1 putative GNAT-family acetyltransferase [Glutamicibacter arilaitensis Re117]HCH47551.1 N-acetyltransferase [Glutamicibacter sp.]HCJ53891.1 N-acetyltransferase [Glutamicibacter sp.]HCM94592.1 N-acetyltransferase [Glutamicibacter sp.]